MSSNLLTSPLAPPTFEPWQNYDIDQLEAIIRAWEWIMQRPSWSSWYPTGERQIAEIRIEINQRLLVDQSQESRVVE